MSLSLPCLATPKPRSRPRSSKSPTNYSTTTQAARAEVRQKDAIERRQLVSDLLQQNEYHVGPPISQGASAHVFPLTAKTKTANRRGPLLAKIPLSEVCHSSQSKYRDMLAQFEVEIQRLRYLHDAVPYLIHIRAVPALIGLRFTEAATPPCLIMSRLPGYSLRSLMRATSGDMNPIWRALCLHAVCSPTALLDLADKAEAILLLLHDANILHNDIAPGNILLRFKGGWLAPLVMLWCLLTGRSPIAEVSLLDFGLSLTLYNSYNQPTIYPNNAATLLYRAIGKGRGKPVATQHDLESLARVLWHLYIGDEQGMDGPQGPKLLALQRVRDIGLRTRLKALQCGEYSATVPQAVYKARDHFDQNRSPG